MTTIDYTALDVTGPDTAEFLNAVLTVNADGLGETPRLGALLTPQGKIQYALAITALKDGVRLTTPMFGAEGLTKRLTLLKLRADVTLSAAEADTNAVAALTRPDTPQQGADYGEADVFPTDVNLDLLGGVDYAKGCFIGQEVASRMRRRGTIRKRAFVVTLDQPAPDLGEGAPSLLADGGAVVGAVTWLDAARPTGRAIVRVDRLLTAGGLNASLSIGDVPARLSTPDYGSLTDFGLEDLAET